MRLVRRIAAVFLLLVLAGGVAFYLRPLWFLDQKTHFDLWRAGVRSSYVQVDNYQLHYFEAPQAPGTAGVPLVLVHGLGSRGEDWAKLIPGFAAAGLHVYVPDLLGYGRSPQPDVSYSIPLEEKILADYMAAMHLEKADVIGWSMGGWIVLKLALDHPGLVDRLGVYDSAGIYFPADIPPGLFNPTDIAGVQRLVDSLEPERRPMPDFIARASLRKLHRFGWVVDRSLLSMMGGRDLLDFRLHNLHQPVLIMWGGSDRLIPPDTGERMHTLIPQSVYAVVQGCGHLGPAECPGPFLDETVSFLKADPPLPPGEKTFPKPSQ